VVWTWETAEFMRWAGGAALIGLAARIAGRWRWAVGGPVLLLPELPGVKP
jgi:hypothetical protein